MKYPELRIVLQSLLAFVLLLGFFSSGLKAQEVFQPYKTNAVPYHGYLYPVFPGTEAWMSCSYIERLGCAQLPTDTLHAISTARLLETCLYNPFMIDVWAFDDHIQQMGNEREILNCLDEFFNRPDCLDEVVALYSSRQVEFIFEIAECDESQCDRGLYMNDYDLMELMMAYMNTIMDFSSNETKDVVSALLNKINRWELYYDTYGAAHKGEVLLLMGRLLNKACAFSEYQGTTLFYFLESGCCLDENDLDYIVETARRFLDVEETPSNMSRFAYPNPTEGVVKFDVKEIVSIEAYTVSGQLIKETKENFIDLSGQKAGTYIIKVITPAGIITKQIIKN